MVPFASLWAHTPLYFSAIYFAPFSVARWLDFEDLSFGTIACPVAAEPTNHEEANARGRHPPFMHTLYRIPTAVD